MEGKFAMPHGLLSCRAKPCSLPSDHGSIPIYLVGTTSFSLLKLQNSGGLILRVTLGLQPVPDCQKLLSSSMVTVRAPATQKTSYASSHVIPGLLYLHCQLAHCRPQ